MSNQTLSCTPGTLVWFKVYNRIWWPAKVVDPATAPHELQYYMNRKKRPIAMVHFESDDKYDIVINMDKVTSYSCSKKKEYVEKGYSLYIRQINGAKIQNLNMTYFVDDVLKFEKEINGDLNIFKHFEKIETNSIPHRVELIKELFSSKQNKQKKINRNLSTSSNYFNGLQISKNSNLKKCVSSTPQISGSSDPKLTCHLKPECNINTLFQNPKKRMNRTIQDNAKKSKIYHELLQECIDGENQDNIKSLNHNAEPSSSTSLIKNNKMDNLNKVLDFDEINKSENTKNIEMFENVDIQRENQDDIKSLNHNAQPEGSISSMENKNFKNLNKVVDFDEINKSDILITENIEIFNNAVTIENVDTQREYFNNSSDSSDIDEIIKDLKYVVKERLNSYRGSTDSKTNDNIDGQLKNSNRNTDSKNDYCFDLLNSSETVQHIGNESHQLIEPSVKGSSMEQHAISDQSLFLNETCSNSTCVVLQSKIEELDGISLKEMVFNNEHPFKLEISGNENLYPNDKIALKNDNEIDDKKEHCYLNSLQPDEWLKENACNINHTGYLNEDDPNGPPGEAQLIGGLQTPQENRFQTEAMNDNIATDIIQQL